jgi:hypothetical protein
MKPNKFGVKDDDIASFRSRSTILRDYFLNVICGEDGYTDGFVKWEYDGRG